MEIRDDAGFFAALDANEELPYGKARTARAEELVVVAERLGGDENLAWALLRLITAYNYGGESPRTPVPLSRLLKLWDERPEGFDEQLTHHLFWDLKWITSSLLAVPEVSLTVIRGYLADMERRYRTAGHSVRPVHQSRFYLARHIGDDVASAAAFDAWLAADRDSLADCDACERREQARWLIARGSDTDALELLEPTLAGSLTCAEEPQVSLATSMLPLVRVGRPDEARAHHLRSYRAVRGKVSTYGTVAEHIEFCALTGNEGRGIEILAEHRAWLERPQSDPSDHSEFLGGVAVLLRRLVAVGGPDLEVFEGRTAGALRETVERELFEITARFDERNGNDAVSARTRTRLAADPVATSLALGLRSPRVAPTPAPRPDPAGAVSAPGSDPAALLARAAELDDLGHPGAEPAWEAYVAAARAAGVEPDRFALASIAAARGIDLAEEGDSAAGIALLTEAAAEFEAVDRPGRAVGARAAIGLVKARDEDPAGLAILAAAHAQAEALLRDEREDARPLALVVHHRAVAGAMVPGDDVEALLRELDDLGATHELGYRRAAAAELRADRLLRAEEPDRAVAELVAAVELFEASTRPWQVCRPLFVLAQLRYGAGEPDAAEADMRAALAAAAVYPEPPFPVSRALTVLCHAVAGQGRLADAVPLALEAAHLLDDEDEPAMATACRAGAVRMLFDLERDTEAAAILEELLPLVAEHLGAEAAMRDRWALGMCLGRLGDAREAARHLSLAAESSVKLADRATQAELAVDAAHALAEAGMAPQAQAAYGRAFELLREQGRIGAAVQVLRARAWNLAGGTDPQDPSGVDRAIALFGQALRELDGAPTADPGAVELVDRERAYTHHQLAHLLARADRLLGARDAAVRAVDAFTGLLPDQAEGYLDAVQLAARIEAFGLADRPAALVRVDAALAASSAAGIRTEADHELADLRAELAGG